MAEILSSRIWEHARNPRNRGFLKDANVMVQAGDPEDGDAVLYFLKIEGEKVCDVRFIAKGCLAALAASSMASELAKGRSLDQLLDLDNHTIAAALGGLPEGKMHCSELAASALHEAVRQYRSGSACSACNDAATYRASRS